MRAIYYLLLAVLLLSGCTSVFGQDRIPKQLRKLTSKAEQGNVKAQNTLGKMYYKGEGVPKDYQLAMKWYRKSAVQGHAGAQYYLGQMYKEGHGVREDKVLAHKWFNLAAAQGHKSAAGNRDSLAQHMMTPSQIQEAQQLAKNFKPKKEFKKNKKIFLGLDHLFKTRSIFSKGLILQSTNAKKGDIGIEKQKGPA